MADHIDPQKVKAWMAGQLSDEQSSKVESHLEACDQCASIVGDVEPEQDIFQSRVREILRSGPADDQPTTKPKHWQNLKSEKAGAMIGNYKLIHLIGEGGMGSVWKAEQKEPVRRVVALKIIKAGMDTKEVIARFETERQALALMDHPNIAHVLDAGATETGRPFFVMELVKGVPITEYCDEQKLSTEQRLELFCEVCHGVQHAHRKGIMHRDIKPTNVLVAIEDRGPVIKIIDFGLAKATGFRLTEKTMFTAIGQMVGTPAYMSPEQAGLTGLDVDTRTDVYSLGVLLYELLTGVTPLDLANFHDYGLSGIQKVIREQDPPTPSTRVSSLSEDSSTAAANRASDPRALSHLIKGDLDVIVMKALEKDRNRRYETPNEFAEDIQRYLGHEPIKARPASAPYKFRRLYERNKIAFTAGGLIAATVLIGFIVSTILAIKATNAEAETAKALKSVSKERDRAISAEQLAEDSLARVREEEQKTKSALAESEEARREAEKITELLIGVFKRPDGQQEGRTLTVAEMLKQTVNRLETKLDDQPTRKVRLMGVIAMTYTSLGLFDQAVPLYEQVYQHRLETLGPENPSTLNAKTSLANAYHENGQKKKGLELNEELLKTNTELHGPNSRETLQIRNNLANSTVGLEQKLAMRQENYQLAQEVLKPDDSLRFMIKDNFAISLWESNRLNEAVELRSQVYESKRDVLGPEHPDTLFTIRGLLLYHQNLKQFEKALPLAKENLKISRKLLGLDHRFTLTAMGRLAASLEGTGKIEQALRTREQILERKRIVYGADSYEAKYTTGILIGRYGINGYFEKVMSNGRDLIKAQSESFGPSAQETLTAKNIASFWSVLVSGATDEQLKQALLWAKEITASQTKKDVFLNTLGVAHYRMGNWSEAQTAFVSSIKSARKGKGDPTDRLFLAMIEHQRGNPELAQKKLAEADAWIKQNPNAPNYLSIVRSEAEQLINGKRD